MRPDSAAPARNTQREDRPSGNVILLCRIAERVPNQSSTTEEDDALNARETYLTKLLSQPIQFRIPLWQREYAWTDEDCERLVEDILIREFGR